MNTVTRTLILSLGLGFFCTTLAACDKGDAKADKKADAGDKANKKADEKKAEEDGKAGGDKGVHAGHGMHAEKTAEVAEVVADARVPINVDVGGYHPAEIQAPAKSKITLVFTRTTEAGCGQTLVVKSMELSKELPLNEAVEIEVEVPESGEVGFACGMDMYKGKVVPKA